MSNGRTPFREVHAKDGICHYCGHYAVAYHKRIDATGSNLYVKLMSGIEEKKPEQFKGGLSIKNQKDIQKRKLNGAKRKSKNGNLDVQ